MIELRFASTEKALLRNCETLLVLAPKSRFSARRFPKLADAALRRRILLLAADVKPGMLGASAMTRMLDDPQARPKKLVVAVLPDELSRHNSSSRCEPVRRAVARLGAQDKASILAILDESEHATGVAVGVARALPMWSRKSKQPKKAGLVSLACMSPKGDCLKLPASVRASAEYAREAARLVDIAPSELAPAAFSREAKRLLRKIPGVRISEIVGDKLLEKGLGGLHAVGRCALDKPRLLVARWKPKSPSKSGAKAAKGKKHVALVGKGITYDTGGLNLKIQGSMSGMKSDMGGAAATLGAFCALASAGCPHELSLVLCIAENAIGPAAFKPDDILSMHSGKTVEINNTDAEGRLVLGDGVSWAARVLKATHVLDAATLTGAQLIATGRLHAGIVSNRESLERAMLAAGRVTGDLCHALPFAPEFYKAEFSSKVADMLNSVRDRMNAQSSCAAQFVYNHLEGCDVDWCHVDLAGPSRRQERGTGFGVALLADVVRRL